MVISISVAALYFRTIHIYVTSHVWLPLFGRTLTQLRNDVGKPGKKWGHWQHDCLQIDPQYCLCKQQERQLGFPQLCLIPLPFVHTRCCSQNTRRWMQTFHPETIFHFPIPTNMRQDCTIVQVVKPYANIPNLTNISLLRSHNRNCKQACKKMKKINTYGCCELTSFVETLEAA